MSVEDRLRQHLIALAGELERLDDGSFPRSPSWVVVRAREIAAGPAPAAPTRDLLDEIDHDGSLNRLRGSAEDAERLRRGVAELRAEVATLLRPPSVGSGVTLTETRAERPKDATRPSIIVDDD
ncbi:MAG: hypothetical protein IT383_02855 [Deltaproteobacteria bacterium]|nr:hypothetical protein [Deltaproteobacteria bacterium]